MLCLAPALAAFDHGGVFLWTQWAMAWTACAALALAALTMISGPRQTGLRPFAVPLLLAAATVFLWFQTLPLPNWLGPWLAGGSWDLYSRWLAPLQSHAADAERLSIDGRYPITIAPWLSMTRWSLMAVVAGFASAAALAIHARRHIVWMLVAFAATGAVHAGVGIAGLVLTPGTTIWGQTGGSAFGAFINQNNACTLLVLGLACAIGILAWRLSALSGFLRDRDRLDAAAVKELFSDPHAVAAGILSALCIAGLLTSGSRGGVAAPVFAVSVLLAFFHFSIGRRGRSILAATAAGGLIAALVLVRFDLPLRSVDELSQSEQAISEMVVNDGRWDYWADAVQAARAHWTVGSGGGTYRYAYLPYQRTSWSGWAVNADNTWLEWTVETGLVGVALLATLLTVLVRSLWSLSRSSDPLDFGLATAGVFAMAALAFTQFFDFGLLLIPSATLAAVLFAVTVARSASHHPPPGRVGLSGPGRATPQHQPKALASGSQRPAPAAADPPPQHQPKALASGSQPKALAQCHFLCSGTARAVRFCCYFLCSGTARAVRFCGANLHTPGGLRRSANASIASDGESRWHWALASGSQRPAPAAAPPSPLASRHSASSPPTNNQQPKTKNLAPFATLLVVTVFTIAAVPQLHAAATGEAYQRYVNMLTAAETRDTDRMSGLADRLQAHVADHPQDSQTAVRLCALSSIVARQRAAAAIGATGQETEQIARALHPSNLRTVWYQQPTTDNDQPAPTRHSPLATRNSPGDSSPRPLLLSVVPEAETDDDQTTQTRTELATRYAAARQLAAGALRSCPLSDEARYHLVRLDFAGGSPEQSRELLAQLASLRRQHLPTLTRVAGLAQAGEMWELTRDVWRRVLTLSPGMTPRGIAAISSSGPLAPSDIVPATPAALSRAAQVELRAETPDRRLLATAEQVLAGQRGGPRAEQVARLKLLGQIASKQNNSHSAAAYYQKALALDPEDESIRKALSTAKAETKPQIQ
ncbi:O-antigen ligase family protein [Roseimaritima sediminicola]|uniref:O-antigen ligase family protein n=1 Tax=Roseimaritima sediminicola TaxID=2662066 RepID=UPI001386BD93|nr:O-antigen ligase family protein [Roseimaritima sediminicola]